MYLKRKIFIGAEYQHRNVKGKIELTEGPDNTPIKIELNKVSEIIERAGYWRKENAIHAWFVMNVQGGRDDCGEYYVSLEKLKELKELCKEVIKSKDAAKLPPQAGFFFGSTAVDEYYFEGLKDTIKIVNSCLKDTRGDYFYESSW